VPRLSLNSLYDLSKELAIDLIGVAKVEPLDAEAARLKEWLAKEYHGEMSYMEKYQALRQNIEGLYAGSRSVIMIGMNYYSQIQHSDDKPKISRYVSQTDYHKVLKNKLNAVLLNLQQKNPRINGRIFVDSAPVFEKAWAVRAGLGWIGKNTCLINPTFGSWIFLGGIATNLIFDAYPKTMPERCGSCSRCLQSCPTQAFSAPYQLDARRCIAYLSIEDRQPHFPQETKLHGWLFGCDVCQDCCPWNTRFAKSAADSQLQANEALHTMDFDHWENASHNQLKKLCFATAMSRQRPPLLKRNLQTILKEK
jgi:epoxyqueuosine reductase